MPQTEDSMTSTPTSLPELPGMLLRAIPTVVRNGKVTDDVEKIQQQFSVPPVAADELRRYHEQFPGLVSATPLTFFYLLAQRAHLSVMLSKDFPWPILGMVHVANKMEWLETVDTTSPFVVDVSIQFPPRAASRKRIRPLYRVEFIQNDICVVRCESTYQVGSGGKPGKGRRSRREQLDLSQWQQLDIWTLDAALGRRYARLSGDYNPIHLHPWLSRWFGFNQPIIHGMYSVARLQADIEKKHGQSLRMMDISFKRPLALPNQVVSHIQPELGYCMVTDAEGNKSFVEGSFRLVGQ
ncbi:MaoC family dehydratase [Aliidiomarina sp. Khilg15.8]